MKPKHASLFNGMGGFQLAAEWAGYENVMSCEIDDFCNKVTNFYWPKCIQYGDIKRTDFTIWRGKINVLTGGFPCQPYSAAGKRLGKEDDRHLWPEMRRAIREIQPSWVVGENVRGLINWNRGLVFEEVQTDLEAEGYEVTPFLLPACAVNAPHRRDRIWFIAYSANNHRRATQGKWNEEGQYFLGKPERPGLQRTSTYAKRSSIKGKLSKRQEEGKFRRCNFKDNVTNTNTVSGRRIQDNEQQPSVKSQYVSSSWERFPTQSPICTGDDGLSSRLDKITFPKWRSESIKAAGNAIVPQVAYEIFKALNL